jgi:predicted glycogen debranching enzyme
MDRTGYRPHQETPAMMYRFGPQICSNLQAASEREWLVTDGLGGYAMGTVGGLRTRRYHGLLVAAMKPPADRMLGLACIDPVVVIGDAHYRLGTHEWESGAIEPPGYRSMTRFEVVDGLPRWYWAVGGAVLSAQLAMQHGTNVVGLHYRLEQSDGPITLELEPLVTWRSVHGERTAAGDTLQLAHSDTGVVVGDAFRIRGTGWRPGGAWFYDIHYREEAARGLNSREDLMSAGKFVVELNAGEGTEIEAWSGDLTTLPPGASDIIHAAQLRSRELARSARCYDDLDRSLVLSADQHITVGTHVVAGYPWFGEWSRDSLISYRGLFLETSRIEEGRTLLLRLIGEVENGLLPNTTDTGQREFNSVDAPLWLFQAVYRHVEATNDLDFVRTAIPVLARIINSYVAGTTFGIGVDPVDGLVHQGAPGVALTWMDARIDGQPVTPRTGKPVEVNALWISALAIISDLAHRIGKTVPNTRLEKTARQSFALFGAIGGGLTDVLDGPDGHDRTLRPNQLLAVSLPFPAWSNARAVVEAVQPLMTPIGLRSLAPSDPAYRGTHRGSSAERDGAYHQGTVWPWLIGPYVDAVRVAGLNTPGMLEGLEDHIPIWGIGSVSETADGNAPFNATGCPFQAWSVAETLRTRRSLRLDPTG